MTLCVYKRIRPDPIRLNINGKMVVVKGGQTLIADNSGMMGVSGFAFIKIHDQRDQFVPAGSNLVITKPNPIIETNAPGSVTVQTISNKDFTRPELVNVTLEDISPIQEITVQEVKLDKPKTIGFNPETIEKLKNYDNKQWFTLKKEDIIKFLEDANIEYKHISSDKWELLKFLKKIIKELK